MKMSKTSSSASEQLKRAQQYLKISKKIFRTISRKLSEKSSPLTYCEEWSEHKRKRAFDEGVKLHKKTENNLFYIKQNEDKYKEFMRQDRENVKSSNISKQERKKIFLKVENKAKAKELQDDERRKLEEEELEKIFEEEQKRANEIKNEMMQNNKKPERKTKKGGKKINDGIIEDADGNKLHVNFGDQIEDENERFFRNFEDSYNKDGQKRAQEIMKQKQETKKRGKLRKNKDVIKKQKQKFLLDEEDEVLDLAIGGDFEEKKEKSEKINKISRIGKRQKIIQHTFEPRVDQTFSGCYSIIKVVSKHFCDQIFGFFANTAPIWPLHTKLS